jgi:hypothetical protein
MYRVAPSVASKRALGRWPIAETGTEMHWEGDGLIRVFQVVATDGDPGYWATNDRGQECRKLLAGASMTA